MRGSHLALFVAMLVTAGTAHADVDFTSSNLPIVIIDTGGQEIPDEPGVIATMGIVDNGEGLRNAVDDPPNDFDGLVNIELRGWSSLYYYPKHSFGLEVRDASDESVDASLLGMPEEDDWVLYAPYGDKSLLRNVLVYRLARDMGWWAPRTRFCEVVLDGEYQGVYVLMEKVVQDGDRIDLDAPEAGEDACGFLAVMTPDFQIEADDVAVDTPLSGRSWVIKYPKEEDLDAARIAHIETRLNDLDAAFYHGNPADWEPLFDPASFADVLLLNELTRNYDAFTASTYAFADVGDVVHLGPVWDYNIALGNIDYPPEEADWEPDGWCLDNVLWAQTLMADSGFAARLSRDWSRRRLDVLDADRLDAWFDAQIALLDEAQARNFERWPILGDHVWPNYYVGETWADEVAWLRQWIDDRVAWLDAQWLDTLPPDPLLNEINYNSADAIDPDDWVEFFNPGLDTLDLGGWTFRDEDFRHACTLPTDTRLAPGGHLVICRDVEDFASVFPGVTPTAAFDFGLSGGGEILRLFDADGLLVDHVAYDADGDWPEAADGDGPTLELRSPRYDNALASSWAASASVGTPGAANGAFDDAVWLLTFTAIHAAGGVDLNWTVLGDGSEIELRAASGTETWTVVHTDEGGGAYAALDTRPGLSDDVTYTLHHVPAGGDEILLGTRSLSGATAPTTRLAAVGPNPFRDVLTVTLELAASMDVRLVVYDLAGRRVATLLDGRRGPGEVVATWTGRGAAAGVYFVCLESVDGREARKITRLR